MTMRYAHPSPEALKNAVSKLNKWNSTGTFVGTFLHGTGGDYSLKVLKNIQNCVIQYLGVGLWGFSTIL